MSPRNLSDGSRIVATLAAGPEVVADNIGAVHIAKAPSGLFVVLVNGGVLSDGANERAFANPMDAWQLAAEEARKAFIGWVEEHEPEPGSREDVPAHHWSSHK